MLALCKTALKVLPFLVVLWATLAVLSGPVVLAKKAENANWGSAAEVGIGLCAITVALLLSRGIKRRAVPVLTGMPLRGLPRLPFLRTPAYPEPPPPGVPILKLLRILRT